MTDNDNKPDDEYAKMMAQIKKIAEQPATDDADNPTDYDYDDDYGSPEISDQEAAARRRHDDIVAQLSRVEMDIGAQLSQIELYLEHLQRDSSKTLEHVDYHGQLVVNLLKYRFRFGWLLFGAVLGAVGLLLAQVFWA